MSYYSSKSNERIARSKPRIQTDKILQNNIVKYGIKRNVICLHFNFDDNNMNMTQVEEMTYLLCYGHQIVYMPTSMPSPVYIANCYADRGRSLYQRWIAQSGKHVDYQQLTNSLSFASSMVYPDDLYGFRVNA